LAAEPDEARHVSQHFVSSKHGARDVHLKLSMQISRSSKLNELAEDHRATDEQPWHTVLLQQLCLCLVPNMLSPAFDDLQ